MMFYYSPNEALMLLLMSSSRRRCRMTRCRPAAATAALKSALIKKGATGVQWSKRTPPTPVLTWLGLGLGLGLG